MSENELCGIYSIKNLINNKVYIGCAFNIQRRWWEHKGKLRNNKHYNTYLQYSWNKYGEDNFIFEIIEICGKEDLEEKEIEYIKLFNSKSPNGYNLTLGGEGMSGHKHSKESRNKISESHKGKKLSDLHRGKISISLIGDKRNLGKHHTEETKNKISETKKNQVDDEFRNKMSEINRGKKKKSNTSSKYVGVSLDKKDNKWKSQIDVKGKRVWLGRFKTEEEAALAYNKMAIECFGENAIINNIKEVTYA